LPVAIRAVSGNATSSPIRIAILPRSVSNTRISSPAVTPHHRCSAGEMCSLYCFATEPSRRNSDAMLNSLPPSTVRCVPPMMLRLYFIAIFVKSST